jgi:hypothetical protein
VLEIWFWVALAQASSGEAILIQSTAECLTHRPMNRNNVATVAKLWAELLVVEDARFKGAFDRVVFAIVDAKTFDTFKESFERARASGNS